MSHSSGSLIRRSGKVDVFRGALKSALSSAAVYKARRARSSLLVSLITNPGHRPLQVATSQRIGSGGDGVGGVGGRVGVGDNVEGGDDELVGDGHGTGTKIVDGVGVEEGAGGDVLDEVDEDGLTVDEEEKEVDVGEDDDDEEEDGEIVVDETVDDDDGVVGETVNVEGVGHGSGGVGVGQTQGVGVGDSRDGVELIVDEGVELLEIVLGVGLGV